MTTADSSAAARPKARAADGLDRDATLARAAASPRLRLWIAAIGAIIVLTTLAALPFADRPGPVMPAATIAFGIGALIANLCTSCLLLAQFHTERSWPMLLLAAAYFYAGAMALLHVLAFPDQWVDGPLIGTEQTVGLLFIAWMVGFPALMLLTQIWGAWTGLRPMTRERSGRAGCAVFAAVAALVAGLAILAIAAADWLPPELHGDAFTAWGLRAQWLAITLTLAALAALLFLTAGRSAVHLWLALSLLSFASFNVFAVFGVQRYTIGWDLSRLTGLIASALLLGFLIGQVGRVNRALRGAFLRLREANDNLERHVAERTAAVEYSNTSLRQSLEERGVLLSELLHRVRNNLQLIDSLVVIQMRRRREREAGDDDGLKALRRRIGALGLLHQQLMGSDDLSSVDVQPFLTRLGRQLAAASGPERRGVTVAVEADPLTLDLDAATGVGLLVTELVSDARRRFALPGAGDGGTVRVRLARAGDGVLSLTVADDGPAAGNTAPDEPGAPDGDATDAGLPDGNAPAGDSPDGGTGATIVAAMVQQLDGTMSVGRTAGNTVEIRIPMKQARTDRTQSDRSRPDQAQPEQAIGR